MNVSNLMGTQAEPVGVDEIPSHELHMHKHFAEHAKQNGERLQPGEWGYPLQEKKQGLLALNGEASQLDPEAQRSVDEALAPPASLAEYRIPSVQTDDPAIMQEVKEVGTWMLAAGLPAPIGNAVATEMFKLGALQPTDSQLVHMSKQLHHELQRTWGGDYRANLDAVTKLINEADAKYNGKVWAYLDAHPAMLSSPAVVKMLSNHARRIYGKQ